ncbi:MAG: hypothetical protein N4A72_20025 [Bacteroidales bacterium]|jgi:GNAT superfamily N-acetyltransferase|nr:hypothetical protein [Bacteroidales bacterium]
MNITVQYVENQNQIKDFLKVPVNIYKNDKNWVRPLDKDILAVFDKDTNKQLRKSEYMLWVAYKEKQPVGRIAAFCTPSKKGIDGGIGFFECINSQELANILFNTAKDWLSEKGAESMTGPINLGDRDKWWGLLVEGFTQPNYTVNYNPPYYINLFENYGFKNFFNQYTYHREIAGGTLDPSFAEKAKRIENNPAFHIESINKKNRDKYSLDFMEVFNRAWATFPGVQKMSAIHVKSLMKSLKPILDTKLTYFAYHNNNPVAFFIMIPDINNTVKKLNGKMNFINKIRFVLDLKLLNRPKKAVGLIFGIIPEHQRKGLHGYMINAFAKEARKKSFPYTDLELNWIGDFNPTMMKICEQIGTKVIKKHITYKYIFNQEQEFKRAEKVNK